MELNREKLKRMFEDTKGTGGSTNSGGGGGALAGYATQAWVNEGFVSIEFFNRIFTAYGPGATSSDPDVVVEPNDLDSTITNIKAMFGLWTEQYLSALGLNPGGTGSATSLSMLDDVDITTPTNGQALVYNSTTLKWENATISTVTALANLTDVLLTSVTDQQFLKYDNTSQKWVNTDLKTINGQSIIGYGDISVGGGSGVSNYLVLTTGKTTFNFWDTINTATLYKMQGVSSGAPSGYPYGYLFNFAWQGANSWSGQLYNTVSDFGSELFTRGYRADTRAWTAWKKFWGNTPDGTGVITTTNWNAIRTDFSGNAINSWGLYVKKSDMSNGQALRIGWGKAESVNNNANIAYEFVADGNGGNYISFNHYANDKLVKIYANGNVSFGLPNATPSQRYEFAGGTMYVHSDNSNDQDLIVGKIRGYSFGGRSGDFVHIYERVNIGETSGWGYTDAPSGGLSVKGGCWLAYNGASVGIGTTSPSYTLHVSGNIYATGAITALSDIRQKNIQEYMQLGLDDVANAPVIKFTWKDPKAEDKGLQVGSIAQYWEKVLPEAVKKDKEGTLSMSYGVVALVAAISTAKKVQEHERRIADLECENKKLKGQLIRLNRYGEQ